MKTIRRFGLISCLGFSLLLLAGCQSEQESAGMDYLPLFGDGTQDSSPVVATVNGVAITERNMEVRLAEMPSSMMSRFKGPEGRRLLLKEMVDHSPDVPDDHDSDRETDRETESEATG